VSGDFPVQLATRLPDRSAEDLPRCSAARLSVCRIVLEIPQARHARHFADILARTLRGKCCRGTASAEAFNCRRRVQRMLERARNYLIDIITCQVALRRSSFSSAQTAFFIAWSRRDAEARQATGDRRRSCIDTVVVVDGQFTASRLSEATSNQIPPPSQERVFRAVARISLRRVQVSSPTLDAE